MDRESGCGRCFFETRMAAKILAKLIVIGSGILAWALVQAYSQALANASKSGITQETIQNTIRGSKAMGEQEARQILGITEQSIWDEIVKSLASGVYNARVGLFKFCC